jgi:hypothetical protein
MTRDGIVVTVSLVWATVRVDGFVYGFPPTKYRASTERELAPGDSVEVLLSRRGQLVEVREAG